MFRSLPRISLVLLGVGLPLVAHADPRDDARRHFAAGLEAAEEEDYAIALQHFLAAQNAYAHPATLFNIAKAYADMDDLENALSYYRQYQDAVPEKAAYIQDTIDAIEQRLAGTAPAPVGETVSPAPTGGATREQIERLQAIAEELEALTASLQEAPPLVGAATDGTSSALPSQGFLSEAYERQVVTASRVGQDPLDSPSSISVVTADDLRLSGAISLPDALRRVVGVDVMSLTSGHQDLSIRGFNRELSNKVLVLIDGRSTYLDFLGATLWSTLPVTLEEIERIEVIRGPGAAVYGANAVTGVINLITRTPGEEERTVFRGAAGTAAYGRGSVMTTGRRGRTSYRLAGGYHQIGRWARQAGASGDPADPIENPLGVDSDLGARVVRGSGRVDRSLGERGFVSAQAGLAKVDTLNFPNLGALGQFVGTDHTTSYVRADAGYDVVHARAFWNHDAGLTGPTTQTVGARDLSARYRTDTVDVELEAPVSFSTGPLDHVLNVGLGYRHLDVRFGYLAGGYDAPTTQDHVRGFLNEEVTLDRLRFVGSLRVDKHPLLKLRQTISPRAAAIYRLCDATSLRATAGTAFRQPTNIESYMDLALPTAADGAWIRDLGNTALAPERIRTLEIGVHDQSSYHHEADLVFFYNRVHDLIFLDEVASGLNPYDPEQNGFLAGTTGWVNLQEIYDAVGVEAEVELYPIDGLDLFANLSLTSVVERAPDGTRVRDRSTSLAKANLGAAYRTPYRIDVSAHLHVASAQTWRIREFTADGSLQPVEGQVPTRNVLTLRVAGRPLPDEDLEIALGVWNALGAGPIQDRIREHPKGQPIREVAFGEVSYAF